MTKLEVIDLMDLMEVKGGGGPAGPIVICGSTGVSCTAQGSGIIRKD